MIPKNDLKKSDIIYGCSLTDSNLLNKGIMTKDLALMVGPDQKWLTTQELINSISNELNN